MTNDDLDNNDTNEFSGKERELSDLRMKLRKEQEERQKLDGNVEKQQEKLMKKDLRESQVQLLSGE